jgi:hypothetical protein
MELKIYINTMEAFAHVLTSVPILAEKTEA